MLTADRATERTGSRAQPALAMIRALRPRQWVKNFLVFMAPAAAGALRHPHVAVHTIEAFGLFCALASGTYLINDVRDIEADRRHPEKSQRPLAAGLIKVREAMAVGFVLFAGALLGSWFVAGWRLTTVMGLYAVITISYSIWIKYVAVVELAAVASGFVLRAIAGGIAADVPLSNWFLAVTSFGALFIVTGKRMAERQSLGDASGAHRRVLSEYTRSFLQSVLTLSATATVTTYCLWAFDRTGLAAHPNHDPFWVQLTIVPFALAVLHILRLLDSGGGAAPEELAVRDHTLHLLGAAWLLCFLVGIYA
jgi:decaprenyl-phosphate phosphoribosyltransferase